MTRAGFCLFAAVLLYTPVAAAVVTVHSMACCTTGQCPIPAHHHGAQPAPAPAAPDCEHTSPAVASCSLQCCQEPERQFVHALAFELPITAVPTVPLHSERAASFAFAKEILSLRKPLSPPPRPALSV